MNWLFQPHATRPVARAVGVFALVCVGGMALGSVKARMAQGVMKLVGAIYELTTGRVRFLT
jgi:hypothetical protein